VRPTRKGPAPDPARSKTDLKVLRASKIGINPRLQESKISIEVGKIRLNEVTFVTHTSATDAFDSEHHKKVLDSPTAATSVLIINPG
jgi:hypothetical protein